jgi:hypothetical protein
VSHLVTSVEGTLHRNCYAPMDPTGGRAARMQGGAAGAAGVPVLQPPGRSAPESGFLRSFLPRAVFRPFGRAPGFVCGVELVEALPNAPQA